MKPQSKQNKNFQYLIGAGAAVVVIQILFLVLFPGGQARDIKTSINEAVKKSSAKDPRRREQLKVQLAVNLYRQKAGEFPKSLVQLTPTYLDSVPVDPATGKPFSYELQNNAPYIGADGDAIVARDIVVAEDTLVLADASRTEEMLAFVYDPSGKRDPFAPYDFMPKDDGTKKTPLEKYDLNELRLTGTLAGFDEPKAMVEDMAGTGFTVSIGTKIGTRGGQVMRIERDKVIVLETIEEPNGAIKTREVPIIIRPRNDEPKATTKRGRKL